MVNVYVTNIRDLPDPEEYPEILAGLPEERKKKILRFRNAEDRKQSLGAGILLQKVLKRHGISNEEIQIGDGGKPEVEGICFNLSHSADLAVCAVSEKNVGCDVEQITDAPMRLIQKRFCENEIRHMAKTPEEKKNEEFYRLWTMKESYLKMTGEGLRVPLNEFEIRFEEEIRIFRGGKYCSCYMKEYEISGYKLTVCAEEEKFAENVEFM